MEGEMMEDETTEQRHAREMKAPLDIAERYFGRRPVGARATFQHGPGEHREVRLRCYWSDPTTEEDQTSILFHSGEPDPRSLRGVQDVVLVPALGGPGVAVPARWRSEAVEIVHRDSTWKG